MELGDIKIDSSKVWESTISCAIIEEEDVDTQFGLMHVAIQGDRAKPAIFTYHDIGMNHTTSFQCFFNFADMQPILRRFCVYHLNAPGQHENALTLSDHYQFPTMDNLSEMVVTIMEHFNVPRFIGFGVGAGANIFTRLALMEPMKVDALFLVNPTCDVCSWSEWGYQKLSNFYLRGRGMTKFTEDYLMWYHFGKTSAELLIKTQSLEINHDLVQVFRENLKAVNPGNLSKFVESYVKRNEISIHRETDPSKPKNLHTLKCAVMLLVGQYSPHLEHSVSMNAKLDPANSSWMKVSDSGGLLLDESPQKTCEVFRLFLQGMGYVPSLSIASLARNRSSSNSMLTGVVSSEAVC